MIRFIALFLLLLAFQCKGPESKKPERGTLASNAMVVSAHPLATKAGLETLKQGGNAIDAAVATHFALAVVYPRAGNIGGGGFAVLAKAGGHAATLDFREVAPAAATKNMYLDEQGEVIVDLSTLGHLAAAVPSSVAGMWELHQKHGQMEWTQLLEPAIGLAQKGFAITEDEAHALNEKQQDFLKVNDSLAWFIKSAGWSAGDSIKQEALAHTLTLIRDQGAAGFYTGEIADLIIREMKDGGGLITHQDLENYVPKWREPLYGHYKGYEIITMPPPSSGGVALLQLLQGADLKNLYQFDPLSTEAVHLMAELERRVFADRAHYLGDPDFAEVPVQALLDPSYNQARFQNIEMKQATPSSAITHGQLTFQESFETTHFSILDSMGNAISVTTTLNGNYGCKVMVEDAGFFLNNIMDDFSSKPGTPNMFGLVGAEANAIAPNKRMLSSMTPTILTRDGLVKMIVGTPGGSTIITSVFQTIINVIDYGMTMQDAVTQRKVHHQWLPDRILVEEGALPDKTLKELRSMGHEIEFRDKIGRTDCILVMDNGTLEGAADHTRGDDYAEGF